jgi:hypothetical protein
MRRTHWIAGWQTLEFAQSQDASAGVGMGSASLVRLKPNLRESFTASPISLLERITLKISLRVVPQVGNRLV